MKDVGLILKQHIEKNKIKKTYVAAKVGITYNYLSTIFTKSSIDMQLFENICKVIEMDPASVFEPVEKSQKNYSDISAKTNIGDASVQIGPQCTTIDQLLDERNRVIEAKDKLLAEKDKLIEEKERMIRYLTGDRS